MDRRNVAQQPFTMGKNYHLKRFSVHLSIARQHLKRSAMREKSKSYTINLTFKKLFLKENEHP